MSPMFATMSVVNVSARASSSPFPRRATHETTTTIARTTPLQQAQTDERASEQPLARIARRPPHHLRLLGLRLEHDRAGRVDDQLEEQDVHRQEGERPPSSTGSSDMPAIGTWTAKM